MTTLAEYQSMRDALTTARANGTRSVQVGHVRREYKSDAELAAALAFVESKIASLSSSTAVKAIYFP